MVGVLITVIVVLGVVAVVGMLFYKKRNPSPGGGGAGSFDNALYYKGNEEVNINSTGDSGEADA